MNEKELYEKQYNGKKLKNTISFPFLKKIFNKFDLHREDLALNFLPVEGEKILDVGCGDGSFLFKIGKEERFKEYYGVDIVASRIEEAKIKVKDILHCNFSLQNINKGLAYPDEFFDVVTCISVLEHVFDPYFMLDEINRVLKKEGFLIIQVPNIAYIKYRVNLLFGTLPKTSFSTNWRELGWDGGHLHYFTKKTFCGLLEECGFKSLKISGSGLFAGVRSFYSSLLTGDVCVKAKKQVF